MPRYSIVQDANKAYFVVRIGSHQECTLEQQGFKEVFSGEQLECFAYMDENRAQFPFDLLNKKF